MTRPLFVLAFFVITAAIDWLVFMGACEALEWLGANGPRLYTIARGALYMSGVVG